MKMKTAFVAMGVALLASAPAFSQQQPEVATLQRAINILQMQRNQASDQTVAAELRASGLADDLAKAQARIKELEEKEKAKAKE
jgi:hypothetical protein